MLLKVCKCFVYGGHKDFGGFTTSVHVVVLLAPDDTKVLKFLQSRGLPATREARSASSVRGVSSADQPKSKFSPGWPTFFSSKRTLFVGEEGRRIFLSSTMDTEHQVT